MIEPMVKYGVKSFEVKIDAETKYNRNLVKRLSKTVWDGGCKSYYKVGDKIIATCKSRSIFELLSPGFTSTTDDIV